MEAKGDPMTDKRFARRGHRARGPTAALACLLLGCAAEWDQGEVAPEDGVAAEEVAPEEAEQAAEDGALAEQARIALFGETQPGQGGGRRRVPDFFYDGSVADAIEFFRPHATGNGRSCATCHRPEDNFALTPATVEARWKLLQLRRRFDPDADDPLFRPIDADDFENDFTTLRTKAMVRVTLPLPANVRIAGDPAATTVSVFRSVPTVMNAAITAPFQNDGRLATLEEQALEATRHHSEVAIDPPDRTLRKLARFQRHLFSSRRVRDLAVALDHGGPLPGTDPPLDDLEQQGKATFTEFCAPCHGGPTLAVNTDARFLPVPARGPLLSGPQEFVNIFVQTPRPPPPFAPPPAPPTPRFFDGLPTAGLPNISFLVTLPDQSQVPAVSSDAGRMLITGDLRENGRFSVPTLFGAGRTAPYFHDNSAATIEQVIEHYQAMFAFIEFLDVEAGLFAPPAGGQGCAQGTCGIQPIPEGQIPGLIAYFRRL
jgi:cytochrome c peroxidase